jgi:hypothetical protein
MADYGQLKRFQQPAAPSYIPDHRDRLPRNSVSNLDAAGNGLLPPVEIAHHCAQRGPWDEVTGDRFPALRNHQRNVPQMQGFSESAPKNYAIPGIGLPKKDTYGGQGDSSMEDMFRRQQQMLQGMNQTPHEGSGYGMGLHQSPTVRSSRLSSVRGGVGVRLLSSLPAHFQIYEDRPEDENGHLSARLGAPNSHNPSRQGSTAAGLLSVPGSRVPSRQPSRQSSAEQLQSTNNGPTSASDVQCGPDGARMIVRLPLPRELKYNVC